MDTELILEIFILISAIYLAFFKSYFTEKGKSVALKEDLNSLTREVESVKLEFTREHEILKADLQRVLSNEISYRDEERNSIIQYYVVISEWLYSIDEIGYGDYNKTNIDELIILRKRIASFYAKAGIAKSKIKLLVYESKLIEVASNLYMESLKYYQWCSMELLKLQQNCESQKSLSERFLSIIRNIENNKEYAHLLANQEEELISKAKDLFDNYYKSRFEVRSKVFPLENEFEMRAKEYLKK